MDSEDQIKWVMLTLNFSDEEEAWLEEVANAAGLSINAIASMEFISIS